MRWQHAIGEGGGCVSTVETKSWALARERKKNCSGEKKGDSAIFFLEGKSERFLNFFFHLELMHVDFICY